MLAPSRDNVCNISVSTFPTSQPEKHFLLPLLIGQDAALVSLLHGITIQRNRLLKMNPACLAGAKPQMASGQAPLLIHSVGQGPCYHFKLMAVTGRTLVGWWYHGSGAAANDLSDRRRKRPVGCNNR
jgi:hypothetical protein